MNARFIWSAATLAAALSGLVTDRAQAVPYVVHFDQDVYVVQGPGETITARVLIDGNPSTPQDEPVPLGLFSFGVATTFDGTKAQLSGFGDVAVVPQLDYFGLGPGAFKQVQSGFGGGKGNIDNLGPFVPYSGALLLEFTFTNLASALDSYTLGLDFFRTVGPNEQIFLDGLGGELDLNIMFRSAQVLVVPEPSAIVLWMIAISCLGLRQLRRMWRC